MPDGVEEAEVRDLAIALQNYLMDLGKIELAHDSAMRASYDSPRSQADAISIVDSLAFADLAVQAVGYRTDDNSICVYVNNGRVSGFKKLQAAIAEKFKKAKVAIEKIGEPIVRQDSKGHALRRGQLFMRGDRIACGSSCGPVQSDTSGTIGALVREKGDDKMFILSANHILAACNQMPAGTPILAPSAYDGRSGLAAPRGIATLTRVVELRTGDPTIVEACQADAAFALVTDPNILSSWQGEKPGHDTPSSIIKPKSTMIVRKVGRTTGLTVGKVHARLPNAIPISFKLPRFEAVVWFKDTWVLKGSGEGFALQGDSGSLVVTEDADHALGMVFAATSDGRHAIMVALEDLGKYFGGFELVSGHGV